LCYAAGVGIGGGLGYSFLRYTRVARASHIKALLSFASISFFLSTRFFLAAVLILTLLRLQRGELRRGPESPNLCIVGPILFFGLVKEKVAKMMVELIPS
jgi:hypothetical protein